MTCAAATAHRHRHAPHATLTEGARLRNAIIATVVLAGVVVALVFALPGLAKVAGRIGDAAPGWVAVAIALQVVSCLGYVVFFEMVFDDGPRRFVRRVGWAELAANSVLPAGGAGGLGVGAWLLMQRGAGARKVATRSVVIFVATSAVTVPALVIAGLGLATGVLSGPHDLLLGLVPAAVGVAGIGLTWVAARGAARMADHERGRHGKLAAALDTLARGISDTVVVLRRHDWRVLGAVVYWVANVMVLWASFKAVGASPSGAVIVMGHLIGQLGGELPIPGGVGAVDGGLIGALVLYGVAAVPTAAAVLLFRGITLAVPMVLGSVAFVAVERTLLRERRDQPPAGSSSGVSPASSPGSERDARSS